MTRENRIISYIQSQSDYNADFSDEIMDYLVDLGYSYRDNQWTLEGEPVDNDSVQDDVNNAVNSILF